MPDAKGAQPRPIAGILFSVFVGAMVVLIGLGSQTGIRTQGDRIDHAVAYARSLALATADAYADGASPGAASQAALAALKSKVPGLSAGVVVQEEGASGGGDSGGGSSALAGLFASLEGKEILAHTDASLVGKALSQDEPLGEAGEVEDGAEAVKDPLSQAMLFREANSLKDRLGRNDEARAAKPELTTNPYAEVTVIAREDGTLFVMAPVRVGGELKATASIVVDAPRVVVGGLPIWALVMAAGCFVILVGFALSRTSVPGLTALGLLFIVPILVISTQSYDWTTKAVVASQSEAGLIALDVVNASNPAPVERDGVLKALNQDIFGTERVLYAPEGGGVSAQAAALTSTGWGRWWPGISGAVAVLLMVLLFWTGRAQRIWKGFSDHWFAYAYVAPAMVGMLLLVFSPFSFGLGLAFFTKIYGEYNFVFMDNFIEILGNLSVDAGFYRTFGVTVLWTAINVTLAVSIGLGLALLLKDKSLGGTPIYRSLLIVPWAVPNYITALIWKGLFNKEFGAINAFLGIFGVEPISWFDTFWKALFANIATNTWLGFPFMMVVSLGALQSIPTDLYEAADVDGANKWSKFWYITVPLLKPALFPAIILGIIWTFNMFNVIYLVSGGAPDGQTEILITEAYRWAFERDRYGYAAAYSTIIFLILLSYTLVTNKLTRATEGAFD